ncbi:hypothetical protein DES53_10368 [Roseimicrobium gellanilyticum]|uniref:Uncharacterized protein n=1 Tax=Roseimicrobium gellanilyticum TaxID=748857 RepID=A0A366HRB1_9BACT|nr:hypothetical protein [Roseimicrobium gellanilyticum]RBP45072.1 hypothetical protein DES53_10368 [Roseimicrobium gellanilyticum]
MPIQVCIEEFSRQHEDGARRPVTTHESHSEALEAAKALVDSGLLELWTPGMAPDYLLTQWSTHDEDVFLTPDDGENKFSAMEYARMRSRELAYRRHL